MLFRYSRIASFLTGSVLCFVLLKNNEFTPLISGISVILWMSTLLIGINQKSLFAPIREGPKLNKGKSWRDGMIASMFTVLFMSFLLKSNDPATYLGCFCIPYLLIYIGGKAICYKAGCCNWKKCSRGSNKSSSAGIFVVFLCFVHFDYLPYGKITFNGFSNLFWSYPTAQFQGSM